MGSVGSGKSSLLSSLISYITKTSGSVGVGGKIAYVPQSAWIMNDTLQENVLLGGVMVPARCARFNHTYDFDTSQSKAGGEDRAGFSLVQQAVKQAVKVCVTSMVLNREMCLDNQT